jgi:hypothetical protein
MLKKLTIAGIAALSVTAPALADDDDWIKEMMAKRAEIL